MSTKIQKYGSPKVQFGVMLAKVICPNLIRQADSLAPPTQPTSPEKKRLKPSAITEYVQNIPPSTNLVIICIC